MKKLTRFSCMKQAAFASLTATLLAVAAPQANASDWNIQTSFKNDDKKVSIEYDFSNFESSMEYLSNKEGKKVAGSISYFSNEKTHFSFSLGRNFTTNKNSIDFLAKYTATDQLSFSATSKYDGDHIDGSISTAYEIMGISIGVKAKISNHTGKYEPEIHFEIGKK